MKTNIDLTDKCGACWYFKAQEGTAEGWCTYEPYGEDVACDPRMPFPRHPRSKPRCRHYRDDRRLNYNLMEGKQAKLPIVRTVVIGGEEREYRLDDGDTIRCWRCGTESRIGKDNVSLMPNGMQYVRCRNCGIKIDALKAWTDSVFRQHAPVYDGKKSGKVKVLREKRHYDTTNVHRRIDDDRAMELYKAGDSDTDMARKLGVTKSGIQGWRHRNFLPANREARWQHNRKEKANE